MINSINQMAGAVVLVVDKTKHLVETLDGDFYLRVAPLSKRRVHESYELEAPQGLENAISAFSAGSGFFVEDRMIATAAHVILDINQYKNDSLDNVRFVCGFSGDLIVKEGVELETAEGVVRLAYAVSIPREAVFQPSSQVYGSKLAYDKSHYAYTATQQDWALVTVEPVNKDSKFPEVVIPLNQTDLLSANDSVNWLGHPMGLPVSSTQALKVYRVSNQLFEIQNNALPGLSGSPVLKDNVLVGIMIRGMIQLKVTEDDSASVKDDKKVEIHRPDVAGFEGAECQIISDEIHSAYLSMSEGLNV